MNQPLEDRLKQLEQATSRDSPADPLEEETMLLRESWLGLSRLLEAADEESAPLAPVSPRQPRPSNSLRIALAIAAALLIAFVSWSLSLRQPSSTPGPEMTESAGGENSVRAKGESGMAAIGEVEADEQVESPAASEFAWDDAFEEELTKASVAIHSARADWNNSEAGYSSLSDRFSEFEQELDAGSL